ncbi:MAG: 3-phosphoshikimate 1-carboxyvinyltransferase [Pseudomonadota bacterium]|nr:3-phosphoshikimate 1-carboxyvinyltransferase [Pseudomonadota bacterium]
MRARTSGPLGGTAPLPGDKSISHRALILGALAEGETVIAGLLESEDVLRTANALRQFGVRVEQFGPNRWRLFGSRWRTPDAPIDCGNSGTSARLLVGATAGFDLSATFTGDASLRRRPMGRITEPLATMGARFEGEDFLPLTLHGSALRGIHHVNLPASAQVKSAILLAGLRAEGEVEVAEPAPSRDHSEILLRAFGADVEQSGRVVRLGPNRALKGRLVSVPGDPSSAAFAWAAAAIVPGSEVTTRNVLLNPLRSGFVMALQRMGGDVQLANIRRRDGEMIGDVQVRHSPLFGAEFTPEEVPSMIDEVPVLAVIAAFARGETRIDGLAELRHKESDRLHAIVAGLRASGVEAQEQGDELIVTGGAVTGGATIGSQGDHRIAMAFAVLGLGAREPVTVEGAEMIATSFPGFLATMRSLGADLELE